MPDPFALSGCRHDVLGRSVKAISILQARESIGIVRLERDDEVYVARHARPRIIAGALYHAALERESGEREARLAAGGVLYVKSNRRRGKSAGFRHEVASALAYRQIDREPANLAASLIMYHYGKFRLLPEPWDEGEKR